jgi:hypothetical protein
MITIKSTYNLIGWWRIITNAKKETEAQNTFLLSWVAKCFLTFLPTHLQVTISADKNKLLNESYQRRRRWMNRERDTTL